MSLHMGAAGSAASAKAMAAYLLESQIPAEALRSAAYYGQTAGMEEALAEGHGAAPALRSDLDPELAAALGLKPCRAIDETALAHLLSGRRADGEALPVQEQHRDVTSYGERKGEGAEAGEIEGKVRHRVAYLDLTFSAPKHLSVAWALAETEAERNSLLQAHRTARDEALRYIEQQIVRGRLGDGGRDGHEAGRAAWITVDHFTARPTQEITRTDPETGEVFTELRSQKVVGDPQLHSHSLIPNLIRTESGRYTAIDTAAFHGRVHELGAVYQAVLARELRTLGVEVELDPRTNLARLPAIPEEVVDEFSKRSREGEREARALADREGREWEGMTPEQRSAFKKAGTHNTRLNKETNIPDMQAWREQADRIGFAHRSVITRATPAPSRSRAERMEEADSEGLPHLAEMLSKRAVIGQGDVRLAAARGFIAAGIESTDDLGAMMKHWAGAGVVQDGKETKLVWQEVERGRIKLTTELHRDQEAELIGLAAKAAADRRHALAPAEIAAAVTRSGVSFGGEHGAMQRAAVETLGTDGGLAVMIGAAGVGKTKAVLPPLLAAWQERGIEVWGVAQAWRQAQELTEAGIDRFHTRALQPFLDGVHEGRTTLTRDSVIVLDELGQIGTRQLLDLMRLREEHGFKLVAVGDNKQAQSIEAGPVIDLLRQAVGEERIPQILTTVRQLTEEERELAGMFRDGKVREAITAKREAGTAELVPGGYRDAVERIADLYAERRQATSDQAGYRITISAPTNADAREISRAVRERRRDMGELGVDLVTVAATDGRGNKHSLDLAVGDRVRLFARTRGVFTGPNGKRLSASIGDNGSVLQVEAVDPRNGLTVRGASGKVAFLAWDAVRDKGGSGRVLLAHGDVLTIDSSQGITSDEHINAIPAGSSAVGGFKAYVAESRHRVRSYLVGSMGAEMREVRARRMAGLPTPTPQQAEREGWDNLVRNLEKKPVKESALAFLEAAAAMEQKSVKSFQGALRRHERLVADGQNATTAKQGAALRAVAKALPAVAATLQDVAEQRATTAPRLSQLDTHIHYVKMMRAHGMKPRDLQAEPLTPDEVRDLIGGAGYQDPASDPRRALTGDRAAEIAAKLIAGAAPAVPGHPYLVAKGIDADGLYIAQPGQFLTVTLEDGKERRYAIEGRLLVPLRNMDGQVRNVQTIAADGAKMYLAGAEKAGMFHLLGETRPGGAVVVAEGLATAKTVHRALGRPVVMALDASNLAEVTFALRQRDPGAWIYVAADNDHHLPLRSPARPNVGKEKAELAAAISGASVLLPPEMPERAAIDKGADWNDYEILRGRDAAKAMLQDRMMEATAQRLAETQKNLSRHSLRA